MPNTLPDYESCSEESLLDVLNHIDKERCYPERVAEIERVLKDPRWLAKAEKDRQNSLIEKEKNKFHLNRRLALPTMVLAFIVIGSRVLGFFTPNANFWEIFNNNNVGYIIPISFILLFILNVYFNHRDEKNH